jgi:hypothetical protein
MTGAMISSVGGGRGGSSSAALARLALAASLTLAACSSSDDDGGGDPGPPPPLEASREFRALAGVSMGGYGAMNLGTKRSDLFGVIASLGGPVDMRLLLRDLVDDNLEVKPQNEIPREVGDDFTFDHLAPYPDRDTRVTMVQDLVIAFGNPFLHHPAGSPGYLASDSEPATIMMDDVFGAFETVGDPRGFLDGGDENEDGLRQVDEAPSRSTDVLLLAGGTLESLIDGSGEAVGGRSLADLDGDGIFDVGDGVVVNLSEPFTDADGDRVFDPEDGEVFDDVGLDGVAGTGDFGEGNGVFDYDPDRARWLEEDPLLRVEQSTPAALGAQRIYMDVGTEDEFGFAAHYDNFVDALVAKGLPVGVQDGFDGNCADLPDPNQDYLLVRYAAGHVGVATVDPDDLLDGNVCGDDTVWQRLLSMLGFLNESFPDGSFGPGVDIDIDIDFGDLDFDFEFPGLDDVSGELISAAIASPSLAAAGEPAPMRDVLVYRPPAFENTDDRFPAVYLLPGYGQTPGDFARMEILLDALILSEQMQNMFVVVLPGNGGRRGSFYVNHSLAESAVPDLDSPTSGRYEDSILSDLIPAIERDILENRVRR